MGQQCQPARFLMKRERILLSSLVKALPPRTVMLPTSVISATSHTATRSSTRTSRCSNDETPGWRRSRLGSHGGAAAANKLIYRNMHLSIVYCLCIVSVYFSTNMGFRKQKTIFFRRTLAFDYDNEFSFKEASDSIGLGFISGCVEP